MRKNLKIAVVGFGLIGKRHCKIISETSNLELIVICDPNNDHIALAESLSKKVYHNLDEMLNETSPNGVVIATPTNLHQKHGLKCLEKGIPVLIEKPITLTSEEAKSLIDLSNLKNTPILTGHHRRHNGIIKVAKKIIDSGEIGDIRSVNATCWFYKPEHYFNVSPWRTRKGAGPISVNLVHDIDLLRYLCGEIRAVFAKSVRSLRGYENEDLATGILHFESGALGTINISDSIASPWSWELTSKENLSFPPTDQSCYLIGGSLGSLSLPDLIVWKHKKNNDWMLPMEEIRHRYKKTDPLVEQIEHFVRVINNEESPVVSGKEGLKSLKVIEAISLSSETGKEVIIR